MISIDRERKIESKIRDSLNRIFDCKKKFNNKNSSIHETIVQSPPKTKDFVLTKEFEDTDKKKHRVKADVVGQINRAGLI